MLLLKTALLAAKLGGLVHIIVCFLILHENKLVPSTFSALCIKMAPSGLHISRYENFNSFATDVVHVHVN